MVERFDLGISPITNERIIRMLFLAENWRYATDNSPDEKNLKRPDGGFTLTTHDLSYPYIKTERNEFLNSFAFVVADLVEKNSYLKFSKILRVFWNWYHPGSVMDFHQDDNRHNRWSIVYNLHTNDGGTEFKNVNHNNGEHKTIFHKSEESHALLFPSVMDHRGRAPTEDLNRLSLNVMIEL